MNKQICQVADSPPILNIAQIGGGEAINIVPGQAQVRLGLRPMPSHNCNKLLERLYQSLAPLQESIQRDGGEITLRCPQHAPPMFTALPCTLEKHIQDIHQDAKRVGVPFATDGGCFAEVGCTPIIWGPGSIDIAHQANEWVALSELDRYQKMLKNLLVNWCY